MGVRHGVWTAAIVLGVLSAGCGEPEDGSRGTQSSADATVAREAAATGRARCEIGQRPTYFVPGGDDGPFAIIGCARLGASGKRVEFSADYERIAGEDHVCMDPAYNGRGQAGIYIPAVCLREPVARNLDVVSASIPSQAVRGYQLVLWGTAPPPTSGVSARYERGTTKAAVFPVGASLAREVGASRPFSIFVVELYPQAACGRVLIRAEGAFGSRVTRTGPRPRICGSR